MFRELSQKLNGVVESRKAFDPAALGDPIANQTSWTPVKGGGSSYRTRGLVKVKPHRFVFRPSLIAKVFYSSFLLAGIGADILGISNANLLSGTFVFNIHSIIPLSFGLIFTIAGSCLLYFGTSPIVFDQSRGYFWKGRKDPDRSFNGKSRKNYSGFDNIHALQIISEFCIHKSSSGSSSHYYSYELNLVLKDGNRINVVDHGDLNTLRKDAETLSQFLSKPVWDAI